MHKLIKFRAFSLIELIVVLGVVSILATITAVAYNGWRSRLAETQIKNDLIQMGSAMDNARIFGSGYPSSLPTTYQATSGSNLTLIYSSADSYCINGSVTGFAVNYFIRTTTNRNNPTSGKCLGDYVTSGLQLYLDAGSLSSYPGSGTTWTDLSGNNNNGTLVNGVGFSSSLGSLSFDQIDDRVNLGNVNLSTSSLSVSAWIYDTDTSGSYRDIATKVGHLKFRIDSNAEGGNLSCFVYIGGSPEPRLSTSWAKNTWTNVTFTWNTNGNFRLFTNGVLRSSSTTRTGTLVANTNDFTIGSDTTSQFWKGNIANVLVYNRTLSDSEVLQNFNTTKSRFGL